jgi:putative endonuclease
VRRYYGYIMAGKSRVLYTGVTGNLQCRVLEHKHDVEPGFTTDYRLHRLVYYETFEHIGDAIRREKEIKGWLRERKLALIESQNRTWEDLSDGWGEPIKAGPSLCPLDQLGTPTIRIRFLFAFLIYCP